MKKRIKYVSFVIYRKASIFAYIIYIINASKRLKIKTVNNRMDETKELVQKITEGIQEKKEKTLSLLT